MTSIKKTRSSCGLSQSLDVFGDKWSLLIIRDLVYFGKETYGDLLKMQEGIATNILADKLVALEKEGLIIKEIFVGSKSKFKYKLTQKGVDIYPIIMEILVWAGKHCDVMPEQKALAKMTKEKRDAFVKEVMKKYKKV
jgi:DNA-binding HxlR family transcriptional regulator